MVTSMTIDQLENMKTHELAELLSNVVLLLRRMPNVECRQFTQLPHNNGPLSNDVPEPPSTPTPPPSADRKEEKMAKSLPPLDIPPYPGTPEPPVAQTKWTVADLKGKKVVELRQIAADLNLRLASSLKKDELLAKLTTKLSRTHSEQYAIQDI
jgi:hypothetical protein